METTPGGSQIQLESDALGQLVSLSKAASLAEYLQQTLNQRLEIVSTQAETPSLYRVTTEVIGDKKLLERRDFLFIALALALGGMVAVISALLWPAKS